MFAALIVAVLAVALTIAVVLCARGVIRRNPLVGIRIPSFFESDEAWMQGHRAAVLPMVIAAVLAVIVTIVGYAVPAFGDVAATIVNLALLVLGVSVGAMVGSRSLSGDSTN